MKVYILAILFSFNTLLSCMKDTTPDPFLPANVSDARWYISAFHVKDVDETASFSQYEFEFKQDGKLIVYHAADFQEGLWSENRNTYKLTIRLDNAHPGKPSAKLNGEWRLTKTSADHIHALNENSPGYEKLVFTRK